MKCARIIFALLICIAATSMLLLGVLIAGAAATGSSDVQHLVGLEEVQLRKAIFEILMRQSDLFWTLNFIQMSIVIFLCVIALLITKSPDGK